MTARDQLQVRVNDELVLDAGTCEEVSGPHGGERLIHPPETTLFHQVLAYLRAKPNPPKRPSGSMAGREGVAAAALVLRWGSYLAVLLDHDKPVWSQVTSPSTSRISDEEMARINIEASAALAQWIDLYRSDPGGRLYTQLVDRAVGYLPMPKKTSKLKVTEFGALAEPAMAERVIQVAEASRLERVRADAQRHPTSRMAWRVTSPARGHTNRSAERASRHSAEVSPEPRDERAHAKLSGETLTTKPRFGRPRRRFEPSGSGIGPRPTSNLLSGILEIEPPQREPQYPWTAPADAIVSVACL